jgi:heme A synthase
LVNSGSNQVQRASRYRLRTHTLVFFVWVCATMAQAPCCGTGSLLPWNTPFGLLRACDMCVAGPWVQTSQPTLLSPQQLVLAGSSSPLTMPSDML